MNQKEFIKERVFFAFGDNQMTEELQKRKISINDIISLGDGAYIKKTDKDEFLQLFKKQ